MRAKPDAPMRMRFLKAVTVVLAVLLVIPGVEVVAKVASPSSIAAAADVGIDADRLLLASDAYTSLERVEDALDAGDGDVPKWFYDEVGILPGARDVRSNGNGFVVGYVVSGEARDVLARLCKRMERAGWTSVPLGEVDGATFMKETGLCTWALITCTQVGADASVVARCKLK